MSHVEAWKAVFKDIGWALLYFGHLPLFVTGYIFSETGTDEGALIGATLGLAGISGYVYVCGKAAGFWP